MNEKQKQWTILTFQFHSTAKKLTNIKTSVFFTAEQKLKDRQTKTRAHIKGYMIYCRTPSGSRQQRHVDIGTSSSVKHLPKNYDDRTFRAQRRENLVIYCKSPIAT